MKTMNKAILVARHEYVETVRTKAFWVGVLAFPIIIALAVGVPILLEKTKDERTYAAIDHSAFLWQEIEPRIYVEDVRNIISASRDKRKKGGEAFDRLPEGARSLTLAWMALDEEGQEAFVRILGEPGDLLGAAGVDGDAADLHDATPAQWRTQRVGGQRQLPAESFLQLVAIMWRERDLAKSPVGAH